MNKIEKQRDAILAGLRLLQNGGYSNDIQAIRTNSGTHEGLTDDEIDALAEELNRGDAFVVLQEGGSSAEGPYVSSWDFEEEANEHRVDCARGSYRTCGVIRVPALFAAFTEDLYQLLDEVAQADFEYAELPADETVED